MVCFRYWTDRCTWASVDPGDGLARLETDEALSPGIQTGGDRDGHKCN